MSIAKPISYLTLFLVAVHCSFAQQDAIVHDTAEVNRLNRISAQFLQADLDSVHYFAQQARTIAEKINYKPGIAESYLNSCLYNRMKGNTSVALEEGMKGMAIFEKVNDKTGVARSCVQIAQVYKETAGGELVEEYLAKGNDYARQAIHMLEKLKDSTELPVALNVAGIIFRDRGKIAERTYFYDSAFNCYNRGIDIIKRSGKGMATLGRLYNNLSQVYIEHKKDNATALRYCMMAVDYNKERNNLNSLTHNYLNIADIYGRMKQHEQALQYSRRAEAISLQLNSPTRLANVYGQLYVVYKNMNQHDSALQYYMLSDRIADSFANLDKVEQIAEMQTRFETVKKESEITRLNVVNSDKNKQIGYLVIGLLVFGILAGAMIWLYKRVNHQKELITRQSQQMEVMMKELHHRVKNNLQIVSSLLSLQTYRMKDEESIAAIRESQQRVQAMSFIHQRLYKTDELTTVNVKEYITDLSESLLASYGYNRDQFDLQITIENEMLDVDKALPIGLIVNEIVTNAFKYAYKSVDHPSLHIACTENGNDINLSIKDNGKGLDEKVWKQQGGSFGKQLVTTLCRQLRAKQSLEVSNGTRFNFVIPKNAQAA